MQSLADLLEKNRDAIAQCLYLSDGRWSRPRNNLPERIRSYEAEHASPELFKDEQVWTFLAACGYAIAAKGVEKLAKILTGLDLTQPKAVRSLAVSSERRRRQHQPRFGPRYNQV